MAKKEKLASWMSSKRGPESHTNLVPQPTKHPHDPLNWSPWRKHRQFITLIFLSFMTAAACTCNLLAFVVQAEDYDVPSANMTYTASAYLAGLMVGPLILTPFAILFGRPAVLFWACLGQIACQIWSAEMTSPQDYIPFLLSRLFVGLFGSFPPIAAPAFIMDVFFLHQRGRLFAWWEITFLFGTLSATTISGFVITNLHWKWTFWWTVPPLCVSALLAFIFLEETNFDRQAETCQRPSEDSWLRNRFETFFQGRKTVPTLSAKEVAAKTVRPIIIGLAPVSIVPGIVNLLMFGFGVMVTVQTSVFLQTPEALGGYGFTTFQNACFTFASWASALAALATGHLFGDRLPLWLASRWGRGQWQPEYRLANILIPAVFSPIGLGIYGAALQYHLHYMVLALGAFFVLYAALLSIPVNINYICECFITSSLDVGIAFNIWRLALGLGLNFAVEPWAKAVGVGWEFGMAAFFVLFADILVVLVIVKGQAIRSSRLMTGSWQIMSEAGERIRD